LAVPRMSFPSFGFFQFLPVGLVGFAMIQLVAIA
jgi:hypothetical protein